MRRSRAVLAGVLCTAAAAAGCAGPSASSSSLPPSATGSVRAAGMGNNLIKHVVIVIQENRSFDNLFATYPGADGATSGITHSGKRVALQPVDFSAVKINHQWKEAMLDWDRGKMDGFDVESPQGAPGRPPVTSTYAYSYVRPSLIAPLWTMAKQYVLADHMFASEFGPSFIAHLELISGTTAVSQTESVMDEPSNELGCDAPKGTTTDLIDDKRVYLPHAGPYPCLSQPTLADSLDARGISWKYYNSSALHSTIAVWDAFLAIQKVRTGPDFNNVVFTPNQVLTDAHAGNLPAVSWVVPDYVNSDHPEVGSDTGPSWVASIVNAVGEGPDWSSTAIIILWDDWGGWYDNVAPPQLDYAGLGFRAPCLIVSPYAKKGYVSHTKYEYASILKTVEQIFGTPSIGTRDVRARSMLDSFDFTQPPRAFVPLAAKYSEHYFLTQPPSNLPLDDD